MIAQVTDTLKKLTLFCAKKIKILNLADQEGSIYLDADIIVSTPSKIVLHLEKGAVRITESVFKCLVIDEADLVLSFGYDHDISKLLQFIPKTYQAFLVSATLSDDIGKLKTVLLRNPAVVKMSGDDENEANLIQYSIECDEKDKMTLLFFIMKLKLIKGKILIFVGDVEQAYRVKIFLDQFGLSACVVNPELPYNSRYHIIQEFNKGVYKCVIATDNSDKQKPATSSDQKGATTDTGFSRGIDFQNVEAVINFDFPKSSKSYVHRIGRTGRGLCSGLAISFVTANDKRSFGKVLHKQKSLDHSISPFKFDMEQVNNFKYRCEDALKTVTKNAIKEARIKDLKTEILNSEKLKGHFSVNPTDYEVLKQDKPIFPARIKAHLKHIPEYLLPKGAKNGRKRVAETEPSRQRKNYRAAKKNRNPLKSLSIDH